MGLHHAVLGHIKIGREGEMEEEEREMRGKWKREIGGEKPKPCEIGVGEKG